VKVYMVRLSGTDMCWGGGWWSDFKNPENWAIGIRLYTSLSIARRERTMCLKSLERYADPSYPNYESIWSQIGVSPLEKVTPDSVVIVEMEVKEIGVMPTPKKKGKK
jgi:hypothetical protein